MNIMPLKILVSELKYIAATLVSLKKVNVLIDCNRAASVDFRFHIHCKRKLKKHVIITV